MRVDLTGRQIGRLTVLGVADHKSKCGSKLWKCICECQKGLPEDVIKYTYATTGNLNTGASDKPGGTMSCGCLKRERDAQMGKNNKKQNKYDLQSKEYGVGYIDNSDYYFIFDKEDYDLIKDYCWHRHQDGYLRTCCEHFNDEQGKRHNKYIMLHQLLGKHYNIGNGVEVDHINGKPYDNRKINLRESDHSLNMKNVRLSVSNTSGHKGVHYSKRENKWKAYITCNTEQIHLGTFLLYEDAVKAREEAERIYFGEFNRSKEDLLNGTRCG